MKEKKFDNFLVLSAVVFAILMIYHRSNTRRQIFLDGYIPAIIYLIGTILGLIITYFIRKLLFKIEEGAVSYLTNPVTIIKSGFLAILIFGSLASWTFDYLNKEFISSQDLIHEKCKVYKISISSSGTHNSIDFILYGRDKSINNFISTEDMRRAALEKHYSSYFLNLDLKKGLLNSYVIIDYNFVIEQ